MKFLVLLFVACLSLASSFIINDPLVHDWESFKTTHGKNYDGEEEEKLRFGIWKSNLKFVEQHNTEANQGKHTFWVAINKFADLTSAEFGKIYNGYRMDMHNNKPKVNGKVFEVDPNFTAPTAVDWRTQGYVTDIKDQGQCGSCWAFSTTGSLEGQHFKASGKLVSLSEQNLVDCSTAQGNQGCNGGLMDQAFTYIKVNNGIDTEDSYPYTAQDGSCSFSASNVGATDSGFVDVKSKDESALQQAIATVGPISVAIDASHTSFQLYSHGVYHELLCSQTRLDHGVLAVGYDSDSGKDYYIVKNSWGPSWGNKGYIWMSRNKSNNCGIATAASYPTV